MATVELFTTLEHCIQACARLEHDRLVSDCLESGEVSAAREQALGLLQDFLVSADFGSLRQQCEFYLIVGEKVRFTVSDDGDMLSCRMDVIQLPRLE